MRYRLILFVILGIGGQLFIPGRAFSQKPDDIKVDLEVRNKNLKEIFTILQRKNRVQFVYNDKLISGYANITVSFKKIRLGDLLEELLAPTNLYYLLQSNKIIIAENEPSTALLATNVPSTERFFLSGTVSDHKGMPLPGVNIFLSKTQKVTVSSENGHFRIGPLEQAKYELVVNMLGFSTDKQNIFIQNKNVEINIRLKEHSIDLSTVVIKASKPDPERAEFLSIFKQFFIGESQNAAASEIINPEVLSLRYSRFKNMLEANSSDAFLIIDNHRLGYRINYLLSRFELDLRSDLLFYRGVVYYEELDGSDQEKKEWALNRQTAYKGSIRHFFRSIFNNNTDSAGFLVYQIPDKRSLRRLTESDLARIKPVRIDSVFSVANREVKELRLKRGSLTSGNTLKITSEKANTQPLFVVYAAKEEPFEFMRSGRHITFPLNKKLSETSQVSTIQPLSTKITVDKNGEFLPQSFLFKGYWSWQGISDMLPLDYVDTSIKTCK